MSKFQDLKGRIAEITLWKSILYLFRCKRQDPHLYDEKDLEFVHCSKIYAQKENICHIYYLKLKTQTSNRELNLFLVSPHFLKPFQKLHLIFSSSQQKGTLGQVRTANKYTPTQITSLRYRYLCLFVYISSKTSINIPPAQVFSLCLSQTYGGSS